MLSIERLHLTEIAEKTSLSILFTCRLRLCYTFGSPGVVAMRPKKSNPRNIANDHTENQMTNLWLTILCTLFTGKVIGHQHKAHASHKNHRRQHQAHVHGQGELQMVFDSKKNEIAIKLTAPMEDIAGFEHEPKTSAQLKTLQAQAQKIKNAKVAVFDEASNCSRKSLK